MAIAKLGAVVEENKAPLQDTTHSGGAGAVVVRGDWECLTKRPIVLQADAAKASLAKSLGAPSRFTNEEVLSAATAIVAAAACCERANSAPQHEDPKLCDDVVISAR